jgi:hypothetical protein
LPQTSVKDQNSVQVQHQKFVTSKQSITQMPGLENRLAKREYDNILNESGSKFNREHHAQFKTTDNNKNDHHVSFGNQSNKRDSSLGSYSATRKDGGKTTEYVQKPHKVKFVENT